ncbi:MAG: hypothetical protein M1836_002616 [Candelina mexicana]|nr:MAG: hypothetical protein M1836_002616 [Candelina mexicana]
MNRTKTKMSSTLKSIYNRSTSFFTPTASRTDLSLSSTEFTKATNGTSLFPKVDPAVDGPDCDHDCESCFVNFPAKWSIDETDQLYGHVNGWATHLLVATGKSDWVRDVEDEKGSVMEALGKASVKPANGKLMLSASNMPPPSAYYEASPGHCPTTVLLLPAFTLIDNVTPSDVDDLTTHFIDPAPTNTTPLPNHSLTTRPEHPGRASTLPTSLPTPADTPTETLPTLNEAAAALTLNDPTTLTLSDPSTLSIPAPQPTHLTARPCPHKYLILLCSQKTRDARCGQSAPLLRREFERHLRPLRLYRDLNDERPGGVGIYFISHVGGHKYAANVMVYRKGENGEASQGIWLARVRPEDCEGIIKFTVLKGKVVKPERQLRGGFDRERGLVSW